jgi:ribose 5-phosphate isomerase A
VTHHDAEAQERAKEAAGRQAATYVTAGMRVGLGTGSTVRYTILALGEAELDISCTATSIETEEFARSVGLNVQSPDEIASVDIAIDGADEVDPELNLTKGGGGALTREKIVAQMGPRFIVVVDESKLVDQLGPFGTPLEVLPFAPGVVARRILDLGAADVRNRGKGSDNGNLLFDADFGLIDDPPALGTLLAEIPGIVEHGIFPSWMVERVIVASAEGVRELLPD